MGMGGSPHTSVEGGPVGVFVLAWDESILLLFSASFNSKRAECTEGQKVKRRKNDSSQELFQQFSCAGFEGFDFHGRWRWNKQETCHTYAARDEKGKA